MTATHAIRCAYCARDATLTQPGRFCRPRCRAYYHRDALKAQRQRLAAAADAALATRDVAALERVARSAASLLAE